jgi:hypothetical protein
MKLSSAFSIILTISLASQILLGFEKPKHNLNNVVEKIEKENILMGEAVGIAGVKPEQYKNFITLQDVATEKDLKKLTEHANGVVRSYAFWALVTKKSDDVFPILLSHVRDNEQVETMFGCIVSQTGVADFFIEIARDKLTKSQINQLNKTLIFGNNINLYAKDQLLRFLEPNEKYYLRLKEIVESEANPYGIIALARFKNEKDIQYISTLFNNEENHYLGLTAIREFPHPDLFQILKELHASEINKPTGFDYPKIRMMYKAIVQYKNQESLSLLKKTIKKGTESAKNYHVSDIWLALEMYPDSVYENFKSNLKLSSYQKDRAIELKDIKE